MTLKFYNTLTRKKEKFVPLDAGKVKMYTCGPTVYDYAHLGNFRAYVFEDLLRRFLKYKGYRVTQVMNITDIDDKTIAGANKKGMELGEFTKRYIDAFFEDLKSLNIEPAEFYPRATEHIKEMIELVRILLDKGYAYRMDGSIYFRIQAFKDYGKLSRMDLENVKQGHRVDQDEYDKRDVRDFVLWKGRKEGEPSWDSNLGPGRPGWHIECSAMSIKYLGQPFDIHTGGEDNIFPHHENEIAQSEATAGKKFVNFWLHCRFLLVDGEKMAKSRGNFFTLRDILNKGYDPRAVRYLLASTHYRVPVNFTFRGLEAAQKALGRLNDFLSRVKKYDPPRQAKDNKRLSVQTRRAGDNFEEAMDDDLNIAEGLSGIFNLMKEVNIALDKKVVSQKNKKEILNLFRSFAAVLGVLDDQPKKELSNEVKDLIKEREKARKNRDFASADRIRMKLDELGVLLEDHPDGTTWKKKRKT
jgi:cysteinyl-tRNA synthetase